MIIKNSILLAVFSILSVLLGIFRDRLLATHIGVGEILDIYNAAFRIPDFLYALSLAFVTSGTVVPFLTVENKSGHIVDSRHKLSSVSLFFASSTSLVAIVLALTLHMYARYIVPGFSEEQIETFVTVTRLLLIQPILLGLTSLISCFAQLKNHFILYGIAPLGYSLGIIGGILYLYPLYGVMGLAYGVIIGAFFSLSIQLFSLRHAKMFEVLPYFSWKHVKELVLLGYPRTGVNVLTQSKNIIFTGVATILGPGVLSSYLFAQRITDAVVQVIQQSVTAASIPVLSKEYAENRVDEYKKNVKSYVLLLGVVGFVVSFILYQLQDFVVWALYDETPYKTTILFFLAGFLLILPFQMMHGYFAISLYSIKDTKSVFYTSLISTLLGVFTCYATIPLGKVSLLYGTVATTVSAFLIVFFLYSRKRL